MRGRGRAKEGGDPLLKALIWSWCALCALILLLLLYSPFVVAGRCSRAEDKAKEGEEKQKWS
jgi:flagellar biosynthesis/type III secretory pathway M-ring protein FliF/YscJ